MKSIERNITQTMSLRRGLLISGSLIALVGGLAVAPVAIAATATSSATSGSTDVEEVTVTARKKEEKLMDVPVAANTP